MRKLLCRMGFHSLFHQCDTWGCTQVCRYCTFATTEG